MSKTLILKLSSSILFTIVGYFISIEINNFLDITFEEKELNYEYNTLTNPDDTFYLDLRIIDLGGVGILPDTINWGSNYEHNEHRFEDLILAESPYIDSIAYNRIYAELEFFIKKAAEFNFNAIVFPGFLEFVNFDEYENAFEIYPENSEYRKRHDAVRTCFNSFADLAQENKLKVFLNTDMVALTQPLEAYFKRKLGSVNTESEQLWEVYKLAAIEIVKTMPSIDGFYIRIGEAGTIYNKPGWNYYSELYVQKDEAVKKMLESFIEVAEEFDKTIIFRTWSVGVGQVGDMHTNINTYQRVLNDINSENLIVSTKFTNGDFYGWLPFNYTLYQGQHKRVVEFQCRREFEGLNAWPNYLAPHHQQAIKSFYNSNPKISGLWLWSQGGGPLRAGPLSIYPFHGFNVITDANVYAMGKLALDANLDIKKVTQEWVKGYFGEDEAVVGNITEMMLMSHSTTLKGLYISEFAKYYAKALGLEPPPMLWIFEWDIVGASSSALGAIYFVCKDNLSDAINEGYEALEEVRKMKQLVIDAHPFVTKNIADYNKMIESLDYQENLFEVLAEYRNFFLNYYHWLNTGDENYKIIWEKSLEIYTPLEKVHQQKYYHHLDFPSYNFREANIGVTIAKKAIISSFFAKIWLIVLISTLLISLFNFGQTSLSSFCKSFWLCTIFPEKSKGENLGQGFWFGIVFLFTMLISALLIITSFSSQYFVLFIALMSVIYLVQLHLFLGGFRSKSKSLEILNLFSHSLLILLVPVFFTAFRSPMYIWFQFWTSNDFRVFLTISILFIVFWSYLGIFLKSVKILGFSKVKTVGIMAILQGLQLIIGASIIVFVGFEEFITLLNDELLLLPGGLSRILGITIHLNIPIELPFWIIYSGVSLVSVGSLIYFSSQLKRRE